MAAPGCRTAAAANATRRGIGAGRAAATVLAAVTLSALAAFPARAQTPPVATQPDASIGRTQEAIAPESKSVQTPADTPPNAEDDNAIDIALQAQAGIYFNPRPTRGRNFGQLFLDHANEPQLNQVLLTISKPAKAPPGDYAVGFNLQGLYGSDARIATIVGITDRLIDARNQIAVTQANVAVHLPWLTRDGIDVKAGILTGTMGSESFDPTYRPFYSFSYLSNFLLPFEHVGIVATVNLSPKVSVFGQIDGGASVSIGRGDPNRAPAGYLGIALNQIAGGKLSVFATTRIGPELPRRLIPDAARKMRYWNDVSIFYDPTDDLSIRLEANYQHDEALKASGYAAMGSATYRLTPEVSISGRAEVYRDETGQLTVALLENRGYARALVGEPTDVIAAPPTTYGSWTAGLSIKPAAFQTRSSVTIRPEIRYDRSRSGTRPYNNLRDRDAVMFGADLIVGF